MYKNVLNFVKKNWELLLLVTIFLLALSIRLPPTHSKWLSAYDPYMQYRYTKYVVEYGRLPKWDVYSYYPPGRPLNAPPLMYYITGYLYLIFRSIINIPLMKFCSYMAAIYGSIGVFPAYLLGKEFSDKKSGLLASFFVAVSPAILTRTMGGFYDTDGLVIFFSLLTMYLLIMAVKKRTYLSYTLATLGLVLFGLTWVAAWYIPLIFMASLVTYLLILLIIGKPEWRSKVKDRSILIPFDERLKKSLIEFKNVFVPFLIIFVVATIIVWALGQNALYRILTLLSFAQNPAEVLIVNISVAELQPLNVFGGAWRELFVRVGIPFILAIPGALLLLKRDRKNGAILLTWAAISFFAITRGIRFMLVFAPVACIASSVAFSEAYKHLRRMGSYAPLISFGFLSIPIISIMRPEMGVIFGIIIAIILLVVRKDEEVNEISKYVLVAAVILTVVITLSQGTQAASGSMSEPINKNWEDAYLWLRNHTAKDAVVGSWWDPGHRIAGIAERRNIADGAHCSDKFCKPGLNTRIVDLGKIFSTKNETEAKNILLKYKGNSSEVYWIVSDDLIGKFRWLQYFGTGCDGTGILTPNGQRKCPLYSQLPLQSYGYDQNYTIQTYYYAGNVVLFKQNDEWIGIMRDKGKNYFFQKEVYYENDTPKFLDFGQFNNTIPGTLWVHPEKKYVVYIPPNLENALFTRMFFYEENDTLKDFELVYRNNQVKIYKLIN